MEFTFYLGSVIAVHAWRILPFAVVIFLAGLSSIPKEVDDAAAIDGATGLRKFWFSLGSAPPGVRVTVIVRVAAHGQKRSTRVWFSPRQPPPPLAPRR